MQKVLSYVLIIKICTKWLYLLHLPMEIENMIFHKIESIAPYFTLACL